MSVTPEQMAAFREEFIVFMRKHGIEHATMALGFSVDVKSQYAQIVTFVHDETKINLPTVTMRHIEDAKEITKRVTEFATYVANAILADETPVARA